MVVADTSAVIDYLLGTPQAGWVATLIEPEARLHAPHVLDVEVLGVLRRYVRLGDAAVDRAEAALDDLADLAITRYSHLPFLPRMWQLRDNVSPRDAAFVALAEALGASLLTTDRRLARTPGLEIEILTP